MNNAEGKKNRLIREISLEKYGRMGLMLDRIVELEKENEELRKTPHWWHWISAKIPPEDDGEVLACNGKDVFIANFVGDGWVEYVPGEDDCLYQQSTRVSYWMPLPEPPDMPEKKNND